jgi:hypothetical protein
VSNHLLSENKINHVAILMDESSSMSPYRDNVVKIVDAYVQTLAKESVGFRQETRVTIYTYSSPSSWNSGDAVKCRYFDVGVDGRTERLPSLAGPYQPNGMTALIDATWQAIDDLEKTAQLYGEHSFVVCNVTDGVENASTHTKAELRHRLTHLPDNWSMATLVPNEAGVQHALDMGFPGGNISIWDTRSADGVAKMGETLRTATVSFMDTRTKTGARGTKTLFTPQMDKVDEAALKAAGLTPVDPSKYVLVPITEEIRIDEFVRKCRPDYEVGKSFYQLTGGRVPKGKRGIVVQGNKAVAVLNKKTNEVFTGSEARKLVGLPNTNETVDSRNTKGDYILFVQSTSLNRVLGYGKDEDGKAVPNKLLMFL